MRCRSCGRSQDAADDLHEGLKLLASLGKRLHAGLGEVVDATPRATPALGLLFPFGADESRVFQAIQRGIQGALLELERAAAGLFKSAQDLQAVCIAAIEH